MLPGLQPGILHYDQETTLRPGLIIVADLKQDGDCESIFTDIEGINEGQLQMFKELCNGITNTSILEDMGGGFTRIGWF